MIDKIGVKLILAVGCTVILIMGLYSFYNIKTQKANLIAEVERHANELSEMVKSSTHDEMLHNNRQYIHRIVKIVYKESEICNLRVMNKEGKIIFSSNDDEIGKMVDKNAESCYACHSADKPIEKLPINERTRIFKLHPDSAHVLGIINPIYNEPACWSADCHAHSREQTVLGVLDIATCLNKVETQIKKSQLEMGGLAFVAIMAISVIIGIFVKKWVDNPVSDLVRATKHVGLGNLNYRIPEKSKDELGMMAKSFNDMTQNLAEARMQLLQSEKMASLGRLAAGVAHEINNPLTGVLTYSTILQKRSANYPEIKNDLDVIVRETLRSREIVKGLLDFARQSVSKKIKAGINEIVDRALHVVENQLRLKHIQIKNNLLPKVPLLEVDVNQMQQVFVNLLVNASDAIGNDGGTITLSSSLLKLSPFGYEQVKQATCRKNHSLIDPDHKIAGMPSIKLYTRVHGDEGFIFLDPVYGSHRNEYNVSYMQDKIVLLECHECHTSVVNEEKNCPKCAAPTYQIAIPGEGHLEGCTRIGCYWQRWEVMDRRGIREYLELKISDTGCGIPAEDLDKIFEPFYTTKGQKGTGLGLAVIWGIIDNHNGSIKVESGEGKGTTFILHLPLNTV
jgi:two-component system NtrC family sensor kinase